MRVARQRLHDVRREGTEGDIRRTFAQFERLGNGIWDDGEAYSFEPRRRVPRVGGAVEDDFFIHFLTDELESSGADGELTEGLAAAGGDDTEGTVGQVPKQRGVRAAEVQDDGCVVWRFDGGDLRVGTGLG